nr:MAG TPA: hypothetical protein [Caudoviricetes sp.]
MELLHKRSNEIENGDAKTPNNNSLKVGEIAINYKKDNETLFIKNDNEEIVKFKPYKSDTGEKIRIFKGNGRPDKPETTGVTLKNITPETGDLYISKDGAEVGAWEWIYLNNKWVISNGDTGWYEISPLTKDNTDNNTQKLQWDYGNRLLGKIRYRRINNSVYLNIGGNEYGTFKIKNFENLSSEISLGFNLGRKFEPINDVSTIFYSDSPRFNEYVVRYNYDTYKLKIDELTDKVINKNNGVYDKQTDITITRDITYKPFWFNDTLYDNIIIKEVKLKFSTFDFNTVNRSGWYDFITNDFKIEGSRTINPRIKINLNIEKTNDTLKIKECYIWFDEIKFSNYQGYNSKYNNNIIGNIIVFSSNGSAVSESLIGRITLRFLCNKTVFNGNTFINGVSEYNLYLRHSNFSWRTDADFPEKKDMLGYKINGNFSIEIFGNIS